MASSVYTKTGDKGTTGLYTGERLEKASQRVHTYGSIDELQSFLGLARAMAKRDDVKEVLYKLEVQLWQLMADIASLGKEPNITEESVLELERIIDSYDEKLAPLSKFLVPGDDQNSAYLHVARTVTRRAEREMWRLSKDEPVHESNVRFLNRLSDLCFILARAENEL